MLLSTETQMCPEYNNTIGLCYSDKYFPFASVKLSFSLVRYVHRFTHDPYLIQVLVNL